MVYVRGGLSRGFLLIVVVFECLGDDLQKKIQFFEVRVFVKNKTFRFVVRILYSSCFGVVSVLLRRWESERVKEEKQLDLVIFKIYIVQE